MELGRELAARPGPAEQIPIADASHGLSIRLRGSPRFAPPRPRSPVRVCFRCISNHSNFLDYKGALAAGLPIGSGEIESGHRYVFQNRLNIAGGWWKMENLKKMIALRGLRANLVPPPSVSPYCDDDRKMNMPLESRMSNNLTGLLRSVFPGYEGGTLARLPVIRLPVREIAARGLG